tara:strand:+ start:299 stop:679 length:381 start_codon:yes stop_codon:yes gene_type:complete
MIFVKNLNSISNQEWKTNENYPGVRWKFLVDSEIDDSKGISCGFAEVLTGGKLTLHHHSPAEIYVITNGTAILIKDGELEEIKKGDVVYISSNSKHALKNNNSETFRFYWLFPSDSFKELVYFSDE